MAEPSFWMGDEAKNVPIPREQVKKAEPVNRLLAYLIDAVIATIGMILCILPGLAYFLLKDTLYDGRSVGKKMMGLQVINSQTLTPCKMMESVIRNVTLMIPIFGLIDAVMVFVDPDNLRFGDKWATTMVIERKEQ
jgi:uncharacterized RDD family membrane protein YckC